MRVLPLLLLIAATVSALVLFQQLSVPPPALAPVAAPPNTVERISAELAAELTTIEQKERSIAETVWAKELLAEDCGRTFESLWDSLNAASNKLEVAASFLSE